MFTWLFANQPAWVLQEQTCRTPRGFFFLVKIFVFPLRQPSSVRVSIVSCEVQIKAVTVFWWESFLSVSNWISENLIWDNRAFFVIWSTPSQSKRSLSQESVLEDFGSKSVKLSTEFKGNQIFPGQWDQKKTLTRPIRLSVAFPILNAVVQARSRAGFLSPTSFTANVVPGGAKLIREHP